MDFLLTLAGLCGAVLLGLMLIGALMLLATYFDPETNRIMDEVQALIDSDVPDDQLGEEFHKIINTRKR